MSLLLIRQTGFSINRQDDGLKYSWLSLNHPELTYDKSKWGFEAKGGFEYRVAIHKIRCPSCLKKIFPEDIRHRMNKRDRWVNACKYCQSDWSVADAN